MTPQTPPNDAAIPNAEAHDADAAALQIERASSHLSSGVELLRRGQCQPALGNVERAISLGADHAVAHTIRGLCLSGLELHAQALASFDRALALQPDYAPAHINRGVVLRALQRPQEAIASYDAALAAAPDSFEAQSNRATALLDLSRFEEALLATERALALRADRPEIYLNRATALHSLQRYDEALRDADRAIALSPRLAAAHAVRAAALRDLRRISEAIESFETSCRLQADDAQTKFNLGCLYLLAGRYERGWPLYDERRSLREAPPQRQLPQPLWQGATPIAGQTVFVYVDQGLGDCIQFARYATLLEARGARVLLSVQNDLRGLMATSSPTIEILREAETPPAFDYQCPLTCLAGAFGTTLQSIPAGAPYLFAQAARVDHWRQRLGSHGFKIGVCWQGSAISGGGGRSFPLRMLERIGSIGQVRLISLQKVYGTEQLQTLSAGMQVENPTDELEAGQKSFLDMAALMRSLDLIISCDTSIAHLAGALGCPAWVALKYVPDWRWLLDREDSPWYPTLRLFRQEADGRWDRVFEAMYLRLRTRLHSNRAAGLQGDR